MMAQLKTDIIMCMCTSKSRIFGGDWMTIEYQFKMKKLSLKRHLEGKDIKVHAICFTLATM